MKGEADSKTDGVHRLEDMVVEEVSLVDRPANKRAFAIVKRDVSFPPTVEESDPALAKADVEIVMKPYPNEHAARMMDPKDFVAGSFRRKEISDGISAIFGKKTADGPMVLQAFRFDKDKFSAAAAKKWLKDHDAKPMAFEAAAEKSSQSTESGDAKVLVEVTLSSEAKDAVNDATDAVEKAGAKMAAKRLARLVSMRERHASALKEHETALKELDEIIAELRPEAMVEDDGAAGAAEKSEPKPEVPPELAAKQDLPLAPTTPTDVPSAPSAPSAPTEKSAGEKAFDVVAALAGDVKALVGVVRKQGAQIDSFLSGVPASSVVPVEGERARTEKRSSGWAPDMAEKVREDDARARAGR